jgi:hypothetical protein
LLALWNEYESEAVNLSDPGLDLDAVHPAPRWWEPYRIS